MGTRFASTGPVGPQLGADDAENLRTQFNALLVDVTAIRTALVAITAKLDLDAGVTDTDYNSEDPAAITADALTAL